MVKIGVQHAHPAHQCRHFRCGKRQQLRLVDQECLRLPRITRLRIIPEPIRNRLQRIKRLLHPSAPATRPPGPAIKGTVTVIARILCRLLDACTSAQHDQVSQRDRLTARLSAR